MKKTYKSQSDGLFETANNGGGLKQNVLNPKQGANDVQQMPTIQASPMNVSGAYFLAYESPDNNMIRKSVRLQDVESVEQQQRQLYLGNESNDYGTQHLGVGTADPARYKGTNKRISDISAEMRIEGYSEIDLSPDSAITVSIIGSRRAGKTGLFQAIQKLTEKDSDHQGHSFASSDRAHISSDQKFIVLDDPETKQITRFKIDEVDIDDLFNDDTAGGQVILWPAEHTRPNAVLLCYDITNRISFMHIPDVLNWLADKEVPVFLLGLKVDARDGIRQIDASQGENMSRLFAFPFLEMSTLTVQGMSALKNSVIFGPNGLLKQMGI
jgi:GTPase SAR1 family protein